MKIPNEISGLFHKYNDNYLLDESLSNLDALLISIYSIEKGEGKSGVRYQNLKEFFIKIGKSKEEFRRKIFDAKKKNLIRVEDEKILFLIKGLKRVWEILGKVGKSKIYVIKSGQNFTAIKLFEQFLHNEIKDFEIKLCDSHISPSTLFPFSELKSVKNIKILTSKIYEEDKLKDYQDKLRKEGVLIEIKNSKKIHDRFIINGKKCWSIGSSIKDLGNKDSIIKDISEVSDSMNDLFRERWDES